MIAKRLPVRRALLSVSDKTGLVDLARALAARDVELLSTGGTARALREAGLAVRDVSEVTGFPEMMDGRVKTLHPVVHGGLLGRAGIDEAVMAEHGIGAIDLLVLNLYPFESVAAKDGCTLAEAVENIDIGGPAMLRSAAKNFARVAVATGPLAAVGGQGCSGRLRMRVHQYPHRRLPPRPCAEDAEREAGLDQESRCFQPTATLGPDRHGDVRSLAASQCQPLLCGRSVSIHQDLFKTLPALHLAETPLAALHCLQRLELPDNE